MVREWEREIIRRLRNRCEQETICLFLHKDYKWNLVKFLRLSTSTQRRTKREVSPWDSYDGCPFMVEE